MEVPARWNLDALYFRAPEEEAYARKLSALLVPPDAASCKISFEMLSFPNTLIPFRWPLPQTPCPADYRNFSPRGDLPDPHGGDIALDSAWALRDGALAEDCGEPGRLISEIRKEQRDLTRKYAEFIPYQAIEYYRQNVYARKELYPAIPRWWEEVWVSQRMFVPLHPVLTYRARSFLPDKFGTAEALYFQKVLEAEWSALVFSRWCSDIPQRGIMWALTPRLRQNINELGVESLLHGSTYSVDDVKDWLWEHDNYAWSANSMLYEERGAHSADPAQARRMHEFVREYPRYRVVISRGTLSAHGGWTNVRTYTPSRQTAMYGTEGEYDPYAPPRPQLRSAPAPTVDPYAPPAPAAAPARDALSPGRLEITTSLRERLREAGLESLVQYFARRDLGKEGERELVPVTEDAIVACIRTLNRDQRDDEARLGEMQVSLDSLRARLEESEERATRAERQSDLLADAYAAFGRGSQARKRSRGE
jgi:hypothetical protein